MKVLHYADHALRAAAFPVCFLPGVAHAQVPGEGVDEARRLIVMIDGQIESEQVAGAGIVFGTQGDRVYIATANHVVRRGQRTAQGLNVQFWSLPGEPVPATLLRDFDAGLDLAVLSVRQVDDLELTGDTFPFDRLGDATVLERGDPVYALGYPNGQPWQVNATPEVFYGQRGDLLHLESEFISGGSSGGGLFNDNSELLGMVKEDHPPRGAALSLNRLLEALGEWGYPVRFRTTAGIGGRWITVDGDTTIARADLGWYALSTPSVFEFKVLGDELLGTTWQTTYRDAGGAGRSNFILGILGGRVSRDRLSFYTRFTETIQRGPSIDDIEYRDVRIQYRGVLTGNEITLVRQHEDGRPPEEFRVQRMPPTHGWFGVQCLHSDSEVADSLGLKETSSWRDLTDGEVIVDVVHGSPAEEAGLKVLDVILEYDGVSLDYTWQWPALVAATPVGQEVTLKVLRQGSEPRTVRITVKERPDSLPARERWYLRDRVGR